MAAFLCSWGFGRIPGLAACGPSGGLGPVIAFEFVTTPADVAALFGSEPCRSTLVSAQQIGLLLDGLGFIPFYTAFLVLAASSSFPAKAVIQPRAARNWAPTFAGKHPVRAMIMLALIVAGLCDEVEGGLLYVILGDLPGTQPLVDALWWPVHVKFALLALGTLGIAALLARTLRPIGVLAGLVVAGGAARALHGLAVDRPAMMDGFTIAWVTILLCAFAGAARPSLFSARVAPPRAPARPSA